MLIRSDSKSVVSYIITRASWIDTASWRTTFLCGLRTICAHWRQRICQGKWTKEQRLFKGIDTPPTRGSENLGSLWQSSSRPLHLQRQLSLANLFYKKHGCPGPLMAQPSARCFPPSPSATAGTQASQGTTAQADSNNPPLEEPTVGVGVIPAAESSSRADPLETGPPLSSEWHDMASTAWVMGPACVVVRREPFVLPERVLNTMAEARAPSTRHLYVLKWSIFSTWCQDRDLDPVTSDVSVVLSFLLEMLDKQHSSSTIKVYTAVIAAFHAPILGRLVGRDSVVTQFLRGARRMNPPRPRTVLSLKIALLLALASVKRVGDLQALSVNPVCLEFGPNDFKVVLKPRLGYVSKVLLTPFRAQVITLTAFSPKGQPGVPALSRQGPENIHWAFCLIQKVRTAFCWLR